MNLKLISLLKETLTHLRWRCRLKTGLQKFRCPYPGFLQSLFIDVTHQFWLVMGDLGHFCLAHCASKSPFSAKLNRQKGPHARPLKQKRARLKQGLAGTKLSLFCQLLLVAQFLPGTRKVNKYVHLLESFCQWLIVFKLPKANFAIVSSENHCSQCFKH